MGLVDYNVLGGHIKDGIVYELLERTHTDGRQTYSVRIHQKWHPDIDQEAIVILDCYNKKSAEQLHQSLIRWTCG